MKTPTLYTTQWPTTDSDGLTLYSVTMSATDMMGSKFARPSAPFGPLSSVATHFTWRQCTVYNCNSQTMAYKV